LPNGPLENNHIAFIKHICPTVTLIAPKLNYITTQAYNNIILGRSHLTSNSTVQYITTTAQKYSNNTPTQLLTQAPLVQAHHIRHMGSTTEAPGKALRRNKRIKEKRVGPYVPTIGKMNTSTPRQGKVVATMNLSFIPTDQTAPVSISQAISTLHGSGFAIDEQIQQLIHETTIQKQQHKTSTDTTITPIHSSVPLESLTTMKFRMSYHIRFVSLFLLIFYLIQ
jgi:hypothetical protein